MIRTPQIHKQIQPVFARCNDVERPLLVTSAIAKWMPHSYPSRAITVSYNPYCVRPTWLSIPV